MKTAAILAAAALIAACALLPVSLPAANAAHHVSANAWPPFAAIAMTVETCAAGADFPGTPDPPSDFAECLEQVPGGVVPCAEREFSRYYAQGAEAVGTWFGRECETTISNERNER